MQHAREQSPSVTGALDRIGNWKGITPHSVYNSEEE